MLSVAERTLRCRSEERGDEKSRPFLLLTLTNEVSAHKIRTNFMGRPKSFRNPTRVSLTLNRETLVVARRLAREARRSLSEVVSEILDGHFRKNGRGRPRERA
jgi:hypothetical protein